MNLPDIIQQIDKIGFKLLCVLGDEDTLDTMETWLLKTNDTVEFFLFLKEKVKRGLDTTSTESSFVSLMGIHNYTYQQIADFLKIVNKTHADIIVELCEQSHDEVITRYLYKIIVNSPQPLIELQNIAPVLAKTYKGHSWRYMDYMIQIMGITDAHISLMFNDCQVFRKATLPQELPSYLLMGGHSTMAVYNYCNYLKKIDVNEFKNFERQFIQASDGDTLLEYVSLLQDSDRRLILRRLIEIKDEESLVDFINMFPEYKCLLPML